MMPWLLMVLMIGSVCTAAMGLAWTLGLRRRWVMLLLSTLLGAMLAAGATVVGAGLLGAGADGDAVVRGAAVGAGVGSSVWFLIQAALDRLQ